jgi:hypothetical protein
VHPPQNVRHLDNLLVLLEAVGVPKVFDLLPDLVVHPLVVFHSSPLLLAPDHSTPPGRPLAEVLSHCLPKAAGRPRLFFTYIICGCAHLVRRYEGQGVKAPLEFQVRFLARSSRSPRTGTLGAAGESTTTILSASYMRQI